ncbi:hypothetical protein FQZ97_661340 [compost metagenome]
MPLRSVRLSIDQVRTLPSVRPWARMREPLAPVVAPKLKALPSLSVPLNEQGPDPQLPFEVRTVQVSISV